MNTFTEHFDLGLLAAEERARLTWPMTETLAYEAAMCLWEAVIDEDGNPSLPSHIKSHRLNVGTAQMRHDMMPFVGPLHIGWAVCDLDKNHPFDWGFTPWFLANCVHLDETMTNLFLAADWLDRCRKVCLWPEMADKPLAGTGGAA
jgi:hypothetical protein